MKSSDQVGRTRRRKVDVSLLDRRRILQSLDAIRGGHMGAVEVEALARKLAEMGKVVPATLTQALETEQDLAVVSLAARTLECMAETDPLNGPRCVAAAKRLVLKAPISDQARMRLLIALGRMGVDVADGRYASCFEDFTSVAQAFRESVLTEIASDEFLLAQLFEEIARLPTETRVSVVQDYADTHRDTVLQVYRFLGRSDDPAVGRAVVDSLMRSPSRESAAVLKLVSRESLCPESRGRAARSLKALKFAGVTPPRARSRPQGRIYHSLVSAQDGVGSRMIWIARETGQPEQLFAIHLMINEEYGIKDCFGSSRMPREDYDERVRSLAEPGDVAHAEMSYEYCVSLVQDALETNRRTGSPVAPQFILLMDVFGGKPLEAVRYQPPFDDLDLPALARDPVLVGLSVAALQSPALSTWFIMDENVCALAKRANRLMEPCSGRSAFLGDVCDRIGRMQQEIVRSSIVPQAPLLRRRLELTADYLLRTGTEPEEYALALLAVAQHLPAGLEAGGPDSGWPAAALPACQNPFLIAMARRSLQNAQAALNLGRLMDGTPESTL